MDIPVVRAGFLQRAGRVLALVEEKRAALASSGAEQWQTLSLARFHMLRGLNELVLFKEDHVLLPIVMERGKPSASLARELKNRNFDLQQAYDAFVQRWTLQGVLSVNEEYEAEARRMMAHIEREVRADMAAVSALLDQLDQTS